MPYIDKYKIVSTIIKYAEKYDNELCGRNLVFAYKSNTGIAYTAVNFYAENFKHLVGAKSKLSAPKFYDKCISKTLTVHDIAIPKDGTLKLKLDVMPYLINHNLSANSICIYDVYRPKLITDKLVGNYRGCIGFISTSWGLVPNTLLNINIRDMSNTCKQILYTMRKNHSAEFYSDIVYVAKGFNREQIPEQLSLSEPCVAR